MSKETEIEYIDAQLKRIDDEVAQIERAQDYYILTHGGKWNKDLYQTVQDLMDDRDKLFNRKFEIK